MGIAAAIPVAVAIFAFIAPFPRALFIRRLTDRFTTIAIAYTIKYLMNCFVILPERARKVMLRLIVKFNASARARDKTFEGMKVRKMKNMLNEANSSKAPEAPAKQNERNFFFNPILINRRLII